MVTLIVESPAPSCRSGIPCDDRTTGWPLIAVIGTLVPAASPVICHCHVCVGSVAEMPRACCVAATDASTAAGIAGSRTRLASIAAADRRGIRPNDTRSPSCIPGTA